MKIPFELIEEIRKGNCALFIGAGVSIQAGLPTWYEVVKRLSKELGIKNDHDFLEITQYYQNEFGRNKLVNTINNLISLRAKPSKNHLSIAELPFKVIFTTNYDALIEQALSSKGKNYSVIVSDEGAAYWSEDKVQVLKIHGSITEPSSLVITTDDYFDFFRKHPLITNILKLHITTKTILFMGYSLRDPDFLQIFDQVQHELGIHRRPFYCVMHKTDRLVVEDWKRKGVHIIESDLELFLNKLLEQIKEPEISAPKDILERFEKQYPIDEKLCFVLMPFKEELDAIYHEIIKPVVIKNDLKCIRADEVYYVGSIMDDIWEQIQKSTIIIAELTGRNPNVFYELGLAHAVKKRSVLITQSIEDVPFDLRHHRCIVYSDTIKGASKLKEQIDQTLQTLLSKS